jgi:hypothetical protein
MVMEFNPPSKGGIELDGDPHSQTVLFTVFDEDGLLLALSFTVEEAKQLTVRMVKEIDKCSSKTSSGPHGSLSLVTPATEPSTSSSDEDSASPCCQEHCSCGEN